MVKSHFKDKYFYYITSYQVLFFILVMSFGFRLLNIDILVVKIISMISVCFVPGYILLKRFRLQLYYYEIIPLGISISLTLLVFNSIWLSIFPCHITTISIYLSILLYIFYLFITDINLNEFHLDKLNNIYYIDKDKLLILILIIVSIFPYVLLISNVLRYNYFLGLDPFKIKPIVNFISDYNLNPKDLMNNRGITISGFYFFILLLKEATGISLYNITRYGGISFLGIISTLIFILMYRIFKSKWSIIIPFFYITNSFVCNRFLMTIRENLSFIFLMTLIFLLFIFNNINVNKNNFNYFLFIMLVYGAILLTSPITFMYASIIMFYYICVYKEYKILYGIILIIIFSLPVLQYIIPWYSWYIYNKIMQIFQFEMIIPPWSSKSLIESIWDRNILLSDFSIIELLLVPIGFYISFKEKYIKKIDMFYIIPIALLSIIIILMIKIGLHFSPCRIIIYLSYLLSILSGLVIIKLLKYISKKINIISRDNGKIITFMLIFFPLIIYNSITPLNMDKKSPYNVEQINDASWVSQNVNVSNSIVIAPFNDMNLLMYVGLKPLHSEKNNIDKILDFNDIEEMIDFTKELYPSINMVYLFMSKKHLNKYSNLYTLVPIIINNCKIINKKSAIIIEIPLS